ncbi:MAG: hypothetical protein MUC81_04770 [Bacteroidia bacterium]|jgi:hypothetical protein|nr:hypothetical protein [Bacteroidia bacterium]
MKKSILLGCLFALSASLSIVACKKDKEENLDVETQTAADQSSSEGFFSDIYNQVEEASNSAGLGKSGPTVIVDSLSTPRTMVIDYGINTLCNDGKTRAGKIRVSWTGRYRQAGTLITITPDSFYQNGNKIEGVKTVLNNGRNTRGNLNYTVTVSNAKITFIDGRISTWNATRNREWTAGENTLAWNDDVYLITGNANGTARNGISYTSDITNALRVDLSCTHRLTAGTIEIRPTGKLSRTIDYGNGICDQTFTVSIGGRTFTVNL